MSNQNPPTYESVYASLQEKLGPNPSTAQIVDAIEALPPPAYEALVSKNPEDGLPKLTDKEKQQFQIGVAKAMSSTSNEALTKLQQSANEAVLAVNAVETMFTNMARDLASIDAKNTPPKEGAFAPRLNILHQAFRGTVDDSRTLAVKIATYGQRFDKVIIPICKDKTLTTDQRKAKVVVFINDADRFATDSKNMSERFQRLKDDFAVFTGSFSGWAKDKEAEDTAKLTQARKDLSDMKSKLAKLNISLYAMAGFTALALPVTGVIAAMSGPFAPFVIIGGLIAAGAGLITTITLYAVIEKLKGQISDKEQEIKDLSEAIAQLKAARTELEKLGKTNLEAYSHNMTVISLLWTSAKNDAVKIKEWLEQGAEDADMPEYMLISVNEAVTIYATMATYLNAYANGLPSTT